MAKPMHSTPNLDALETRRDRRRFDLLPQFAGRLVSDGIGIDRLVSRSHADASAKLRAVCHYSLPDR